MVMNGTEHTHTCRRHSPGPSYPGVVALVGSTWPVGQPPLYMMSVAGRASIVVYQANVFATASCGVCVSAVPT